MRFRVGGKAITEGDSREGIAALIGAFLRSPDAACLILPLQTRLVRMNGRRSRLEPIPGNHPKVRGGRFACLFRLRDHEFVELIVQPSANLVSASHAG